MNVFHLSLSPLKPIGVVALGIFGLDAGGCVGNGIPAGGGTGGGGPPGPGGGLSDGGRPPLGPLGGGCPPGLLPNPPGEGVLGGEFPGL